jgi:hypothetical protein
MSYRARWAPRSLLLIAALLASASACDVSVPVTDCMNMSGPSALVTNAKLLRLDVYPANTPCAGNHIAPTAGPPDLTQSFRPGDPVTLAIPPGMHTLVLTTFADSGGTMLLGSACAFVELRPGEKFCQNLTVTPGPDMAVPDMAAPIDQAMCTGASCPCTTLPDNCPAREYCDPITLMCASGCKTASDCAGAPGADGGAGDGGVAAALCNTQRHVCVECLGPGDCPGGEICSPSGFCVVGCDLSVGKTCPGTLTCCNMLCVDTRSDPLNCSQCAMACTGGATQCCNGVCSNPSMDKMNCGGCGNACSMLNAMATSCNIGTCGWTCNMGFAHCSTGNTGCETDITQLTNCGGCGNRCDNVTSTNATCDGTRCSYTCKPGLGDCVQTAPDTNGCETNLVSTMQKVCSNMCVPASSCCAAADCMSPPSACYNTAGTCPAVGGTCTYSLKSGAMVCGSACCQALNGTCGATCGLTCSSGFADCDLDTSDGCEVNLAAAGKKLCGSLCINVSSCCSNADCTSPPSPAACYNTGVCPSSGSTCSYTQKSGSQICGSTCCIAANGTCNAACQLSCTSGFADCDANVATGCETNLAAAGKKLCAGSCINVTSCCTSADCTTPPGPAACYNAGVCSGAGGSCSYTQKAGSQICGSTCCNAINGTCNASCMLSCTSGFADCDADPSNGCETNLAASGQKLCGSLCISTSSCCTTADCNSPPAPSICYQSGTCPSAGSTCSYPLKSGSRVCGGTCCNAVNGTCNVDCTLACTSGFADCNGNPSDGCEINLAVAGQKVCMGSCIPVASCCTGSDCTSPPSPAACYNSPGTCSGIGGSCSYSTKPGAQICGSSCCVASNGTCDGSCGLTCTAGYASCDAQTANGCECASAATAAQGTVGGCCGGACQVAHDNGVGQSFFDCAALGTHNQTQAMEACKAYTGDASGAQCMAFACQGGGQNGVVCNQTSPLACVCWNYTGTNIGHFHNSGVVGQCFCPSAAEGTWN